MSYADQGKAGRTVSKEKDRKDLLYDTESSLKSFLMFLKQIQSFNFYIHIYVTLPKSSIRSSDSLLLKRILPTVSLMMQIA